MKDLKYNFLMNLILTMSNFLFPLITFPYVSRVLGPSGMGISSFAMSVASYFIILATLGSATYGIRVCSRARNNKEELSKVTQEILLINIMTMIISYVILVLLTYSFDRFYEYRNEIFVASLIVFLNVFCVDWFYRGIEKYSYITAVSLFFKCLALVSTFIFIHSKHDYVIFIFISVISLSGSGLVNIFNLRKNIYLKKYSNYNFRKHIKPMLTFFLMSLAISIYTYTDSILLGHFTNLEEVGYYNVATRIKGILLSIVTSLGVVLLPKLSFYIKNGMQKDFNDTLVLSIKFIVTFSLPLVIFSIFFAKEIVFLLSGEEFVNAIILVQISSLAIIIVGITNILGIQILVPLEKENKLFISVMIGAIFNIICNLALIPLISAKGAALSMVIAELLILIVQLFFLKEYLFLFLKVNYIKLVISVSVSLYFVYLIQDYIPKNNLVILILSGSVFFMIYLFTLAILKENILKEILKSKFK